jgi:uncharacterized damage-inducible protein DinB
MYRTLDEFFDAYDYSVECTKKTFALLTDENLGQSVSGGYRTLGQIAWHIVATLPEMMNRTGLGLSLVDFDSPPPDSAKTIIENYEAASSELRNAIKSKWTDETLMETDDMYGEQWPRSKSVTALIHHEIHHRGQMTVLLRQAGQKVPGLFGPSKEEWTQYGMQPPPY